MLRDAGAMGWLGSRTVAAVRGRRVLVAAVRAAAHWRQREGGLVLAPGRVRRSPPSHSRVAPGWRPRLGHGEAAVRGDARGEQHEKQRNQHDDTERLGGGAGRPAAGYECGVLRFAFCCCCCCCCCRCCCCCCRCCCCCCCCCFSKLRAAYSLPKARPARSTRVSTPRASGMASSRRCRARSALLEKETPHTSHTAHTSRTSRLAPAAPITAAPPAAAASAAASTAAPSAPTATAVVAAAAAASAFVKTSAVDACTCMSASPSHLRCS